MVDMNSSDDDVGGRDWRKRQKDKTDEILKEIEEMRRKRKAEEEVIREIKKSYPPNKVPTSTLTVVKEKK